MAYQIIGQLYKIGQTENIPTRTGSTIQRRAIVIRQRRFNQATGEEYEPNFPELEFSGQRTAELDRYQAGQIVAVRFDVTGIRYNDKNTGEERYMTRLRAFSIAPYVATQPAAPQPAQAVQRLEPTPAPAQRPAPAPAPVPNPYAAAPQPAPAPQQYPYQDYAQPPF